MDLAVHNGANNYFSANYCQNSVQSYEHNWNQKKRSTTDEEATESRSRYKILKVSSLASLERDEIFGVLNFVYLSPKAKFFNMNSADITSICLAYPKKYGKDPSDPEYTWIDEPGNDLLKEGKLFEMPVIYESSNYSELFVCVELKGQPGIPTIIGYENLPWSTVIIRKKCSEDLPASLTVHQMAEQLLQVLHNIHKQGLTHGNLNSSCVEWDDDKIILICWKFAHLRGDCSLEYQNDYDMAQPFSDLAAAGRVISEWATQRDCAEQFESLVNRLTNPNAFQRLTAMQELNFLQQKDVLNPYYLENDSLFVQKSYQQVCNHFVAQFQEEIKASSINESNFEECQWHTEAATDRWTQLKFGTRNGAQVFAKIKRSPGPIKSIAWEYYATKIMSDKSKHFPSVIASIVISEGNQPGFVIVMPEYHIEPKVKNLRKTFAELLSALATLQRYGLVHADIAPQNIMWDDDDTLILIDFGSSFMVNHEAIESMYRGHHGFMAPEHIPTLASDVFSVGRVMLYYMNQWKQQDADLLQLIEKMVHSEWCKRPTVEQLEQMWQELDQIEKLS